MLGLLFSMVLSLTLGYLLIGCLLQTSSRHTFDRLMNLSLGTGLGLGLSSGIYFVGVLIFTPSGHGLLLFDTGIHTGVIFGLLLICKRRSNKRIIDPPSTELSLKPAAINLFWACLAISICTLGFMALQSPYGGQDALGIWNLRARILMKGQSPWLQDLTTLGQHPDYPLLLPSLVARSWSYYGSGAWWIPFLIQGFFVYGTILGLTAVVAKVPVCRRMWRWPIISWPPWRYSV